jgi:AAA15 family ATPase/GTPase
MKSSICDTMLGPFVGGSDRLMINSLEIKNFRCFKNLKLGGLKRFNIVVGESGSGKTALLESIFLAGAGSPEIYFRLRKWRGHNEGIRMSGSRGSYESLFRDLFFDFDQASGASIMFTDSSSGTRSVSIHYSGNDEYNLPLRASSENVFVVDPIIFRWKNNNRSFESKVELKDGALKFSGSFEVYPAWMISPAIPENYAQNFSDLSKARKSDAVVAAVRQQFPQVRNITLESLVGELQLYVDVDYLDSKIPIGLLSAGITKYVWILISIASNPGGVILIDEIENGFYYKQFKSFLESIYVFAESQGVQIIASTHSYEMLQAIGEVIAAEDGREGKFTLLRAERNGKESTITRVTGESYKSAIEQGFEVR